MQELIDTKSAAPLIGITPSTLENWRVRGEGPPFHKMPGRTGKVLYDPEDIAVWREKRRFLSTAEANAADIRDPALFLRSTHWQQRSFERTGR